MPWAWFHYITTLSDTIFTFIDFHTNHKESDNTDYLDNKIEKEKLNLCFSEEQASVQKLKRGSEICKKLGIWTQKWSFFFKICAGTSRQKNLFSQSMVYFLATKSGWQCILKGSRIIFCPVLTPSTEILKLLIVWGAGFWFFVDWLIFDVWGFFNESPKKCTREILWTKRRQKITRTCKRNRAMLAKLITIYQFPSLNWNFSVLVPSLPHVKIWRRNGPN